MIIDFAFKHMPVSDALREHAQEKSEKLTRFFDGKIHVRWNFTREHEEFIAHCHLLGNHMDFFGEATETDARAAIDEALVKIEKQIKKHKEIVTEHHRS
jgi:putative sigma-54 modulation protein